MLGNVWEWCQNWENDKTQEKKVMRGGAYSDYDYRISIYQNSNERPNETYSDTGFRLCKDSIN